MSVIPDRYNSFWLACLAVIFVFMTTSTPVNYIPAGEAKPDEAEGKQPKIQINLNKTQGQVDAHAFGLTVAAHGNEAPELQYAFRTFTGTQQMKSLGFRSLSYSMDHDDWAAPYNTYTAMPELFPLVMKTDEYLQLAKSVGAEPIIAVNITIKCHSTDPLHPSTDNVKCDNAAPSDAASWLSYIKAHNGGLAVKYVQLGTEPYAGCRYWTKDEGINCGNGDYGGHRVALPQEVYAQRVASWAAALKKVDPTIKVGLHLQPNTTTICDTSCGPDWDQYLLKRVGSQIDFVLTHNYYLIDEPASSLSQAQKLSYYQEQLDMRLRKNQVGATPAIIRQELFKWLPNKTKAKTMPIFVGEYNAGLVRDNAPTARVTGRMSLYTGMSVAEVTLDMLSPVQLNGATLPGAQRSFFLDLNSLPAMLAQFLPFKDPLATLVYAPAWQMISAIQEVQGKTWVATSIQNNPTIKGNATLGKSRNALNIYSAKQGKQVWIAVFNHDNLKSFKTDLQLVGGSPVSGTVTRIGDTAQSFLDMNTAQSPDHITPVTTNLKPTNFGGSAIKGISFPPHSLTVLSIKLK